MGAESPPLNYIENIVAMTVDQLPRGCDIPLNLFEKCMLQSRFGGFYIELGAGDGEKARLLRHSFGSTTVAIDINPQAVDAAKAKGIVSAVSDVRHFEVDSWGIGSLALLEGAALTFMEGVLCNQLGMDWRKVLASAFIFTTPEGYILNADILKVDPNSPVLRSVFESEEEFSEYIGRWQRRYAENLEAARLLGITLTDGEFIVAKMGVKKHLEWGDAESLVGLYNSEYFERLAKYLDSEEIVRYAETLGLEALEFTPTVFYSREGKPLLGYVAVWRKGDTYAVHPFYKGLTHMGRADCNESLGQIKLRPGYLRLYQQRLGRNLAPYGGIEMFRSMFSFKG